MNLKNTCFTLLVTLLIFSCKTRENIIYFQENNNRETKVEFEPILKPNDLLDIHVHCQDENSYKLFNKLENISSTRGYNNGVPAFGGYLINKDGEIVFPLIGVIKVGGLTRQQAIDELTKLIITYTSSPIVEIQISNFKITILGDVKAPGTYAIPNERISIIEAIGLAGDLNITGKRKNVLLIREINGVKTQFRIDLTKDELLTSDLYYLSQNDILYIEPNRAKLNSSLVGSSSSIILSIASLIITTINVISK